MNYDVVVGVGCSFMNGDRIVDNDGKCIGRDFVSTKLLSEKLECDYVHMGTTGSSNERMFKNIYEWIENNNETGHYEKPLFVIGLSGTARWMFRSQHLKRYFDLQPAHIQNYDDEALEKVNFKVTDHMESVDKLREWLEYYMTWIYDIEEHDLKLQRSVMMLHHYLKGNNCDYRIHNSLEDSLGDIKDKINYISFQDDNYMCIRDRSTHLKKENQNLQCIEILSRRMAKDFVRDILHLTQIKNYLKEYMRI